VSDLVLPQKAICASYRSLTLPGPHRRLSPCCVVRWCAQVGGEARADAGLDRRGRWAAAL